MKGRSRWERSREQIDERESARIGWGGGEEEDCGVVGEE